MPRLTTCLWFDDQAEEAAKFYCSIFPNSRITDVRRYGDAGPGPKGQVMSVAWELDGHRFIGINGGPLFKFSEAVSISVDCKDQEEVDYYWSKLTAGGQESQCGWLKDKYGLSWQVVPSVLNKLLAGQKAKQVTEAFLKMRKFDIAALERAAS